MTRVELANGGAELFDTETCKVISMPSRLDNHINCARHEGALTAGTCERNIIEQTLNESVKSRGHLFASFATPGPRRKWRYAVSSWLIVPGVERNALQQKLLEVDTVKWASTALHKSWGKARESEMLGV